MTTIMEKTLRQIIMEENGVDVHRTDTGWTLVYTDYHAGWRETTSSDIKDDADLDDLVEALTKVTNADSAYELMESFGHDG